ncbi:MAG: hypothetical protein EBU31_10515 [Proteobacteria bacterium]|nr:hypothetical protein [Pseudomonadota bacterium]
MADDRLRFDFTHPKAMSHEELAKVEMLVNAKIAKTMVVDAKVVPLELAKAINGVRAVFGERYPDPVRVVSIGATVPDLLADPSNPRWRECSVEFCGGTHTRSSEEVQHFAILSEGASSAGIRRIFAVTGTAAHAAAATAANLEQRLAAARKLEGEALTEEVTAIASALTELPVSVVFRHRVEPAVVELREKAKEWRKAQEGANREVVVAQAREIAERASGLFIVESVTGAGRRTPGLCAGRRTRTREASRCAARCEGIRGSTARCLTRSARGPARRSPDPRISPPDRRTPPAGPLQPPARSRSRPFASRPRHAVSTGGAPSCLGTTRCASRRRCAPSPRRWRNP